MTGPRPLAEILPEVAAALQARQAQADARGDPWCVVLHMASRCDAWPEMSCLMEVISWPGMTRADADAAAAVAPDWTRPHVLHIMGKDLWTTA